MCLSKEEGDLGFSDHKAFNVALLAKYGQQITDLHKFTTSQGFTDLHKLLHRAFKIRYFPNGDFLIAELGNWPSNMLGEALWQPKVVSNKGTGGSWAMETQQQYGKINGYIKHYSSTSVVLPTNKCQCQLIYWLSHR